jgi:hypothetical protein
MLDLAFGEDSTMALIEEKAATLGELLDAVQRIRNVWNPTRRLAEEIWFRGHGRRHYQLTPGLYRTHVARYKYDEYSMVMTFASLSNPYLHARPQESWEWYYLAQHYRLPTRLLDWTESLLTSAYFAIAGDLGGLDRPALDEILCQPRQAATHDQDSPTIWMLDAGSLNNWSTGIDASFSPPHHKVTPYLWDQLRASQPSDAQWPIAIAPPRQNPRIVAQQGNFTIHGHLDTAIDDLAQHHDPDEKIQLACIALDRSNLAFIWDELRLAGVTRFSIYQDLDSVAEHVKWVYQNS